MERTERSRGGDRGFTIIELTVAIGLAAVMFAALASVMVSSMRVLSVQKSRTQGNNLATLGIEDLQRLSYNSLGLCPGADAADTGYSWTPPSDLADTAKLTVCGGSPTRFGPCSTAGSAPAGSVPDEWYKCTVRAIPYTVSRFIAYGDVAHTEKRLAVIVEWTDQGGFHRVSQQSSLRIPSQNAVIGLSLPQILNGGTGVAPGNLTLNPDGTNAIALNLNAQTSGLDGGVGDTVIAVLETVGASGRQQNSVPLSQVSTNVWQGSLAPGSFRFGPGTQYVVFTGTRKKDGKVGSYVNEPALTVNAATTPPGVPSVSVQTQPPDPITLTPQGDLTSSVTISAITTNISAADQVSMTFATQIGAVSVAMQPSTTSWPCSLAGGCSQTWTAVLSPSTGYHFLPSPPNRKFYITAKQTIPGGGADVDNAWTVTTATNAVAFS